MNAAPASPAAEDTANANALASAHTRHSPDLFRQLQGCLLFSTCQAGKLVLLRPDGAKDSVPMVA